MLNKSWFCMILICVVGVVLRIALPAHAVFANGQVNYIGPDSYWRMQNAREVIEAGNYGFNYDSLLAVFRQAAVIVPVLLGIGVIIMVYFIGRRLFNNERPGLIAAGFLAVWPGEFMVRTFMGYTDHHALEVFITTGAALVVIYIVTQKSVLTFKSLAGVILILALFFAYKDIWGGIILPIFNQSAQTMILTGETVPLGSSPNYIPQIDFALACIGGYILVRRGTGWQKWLVLAWLIVMTVATIYQVRFDYYLVIPVAILTGFWMARMFESKPVLNEGR